MSFSSSSVRWWSCSDERWNVSRKKIFPALRRLDKREPSLTIFSPYHDSATTISYIWDLSVFVRLCHYSQRVPPSIQRILLFLGSPSPQRRRAAQVCLQFPWSSYDHLKWRHEHGPCCQGSEASETDLGLHPWINHFPNFSWSLENKCSVFPQTQIITGLQFWLK